MKTLIPPEHCHYSMRDLLRNLLCTSIPKYKKDRINLKGIGECIPIRSGRAALVTALKALNLTKQSRVGVPLYTCPVVIKAILEANCKPFFIDSELHTYCISTEDLSKKCKNIDALIAVHMFGHVCDMERIREIMGNKPIIEDCAQAIGSQINGNLVGSLSTIAVFSFRSGKYVSVGEGGALFSADPSIRTRLSQLINNLPVPNRFEEYKHITKTYIRTKLRSAPLYGCIGYYLWQIYTKKVDFKAQSPIELSQIFRADLSTTIHRLKNIEATIHQQRAYAEFHKTHLQINPDMLCSEKPGTFYNRYLYPILFSTTEQRDLMAKYLHKQNIGSIKPYNDIVEIATQYFDYSGDCPITEQFSKKLLVIPSYAALKKTDVQWIAHCLNEGWKKIKNC